MMNCDAMRHDVIYIALNWYMPAPAANNNRTKYKYPPAKHFFSPISPVHKHSSHSWTYVSLPQATDVIGGNQSSQVFYSYTYGTGGWLAIQAMPLIISPTMIVALLSPEVREASST
jgi:hypothetical protein